MKNSARLAWILPVLLTLAVFWQTTGFDFIEYDDQIYISENPYIQQGLTPQGVRWAFCAGLCFYSPNVDYWQPITMISHMLDINFWELNPHGHHATNLFLHLANCLLVYFIFVSLSGGNFGLAAWVAAAFAIQPAQGDVVPWVTARKDLMALFFGFWTLWIYLSYAKKTSWPRYFLLMAVYACSLMSKPLLLAMPLLLLLLDYGPLARPQKMEGGVRKIATQLIFEKWGIFLLAVFSAGVTFFANSKVTTAGFFYREIPISIWKYVQDFIYPASLAIFEVMPIHQPRAWSEFFVATALLVIFTLILTKTARAGSWIRTGWLWFLASLAPLIMLRQESRFLPLASIGLLMMTAEGFGWICRRGKVSAMIKGWAAISFLCGWGMITFIHTGHWKNTLAFAEYGVRTEPASPKARHMLAQALWKRGAFDLAWRHLNEAERLFPNYLWMNENMEVMLISTGQWQRAIVYSKLLLRLSPHRPQAYNNYGFVLARQNRCAEAIPQFKKALSLYSEFVDARINLADCLIETGKKEEAIFEYEKVLELVPLDDQTQAYYGFLLVRAGRYEEAIQHFEGLVRRRPKNALAHNGWGITLAFLNQPDEAILHFKEALRINPRLAETYNNLALLLIPQGKHNEAAGYFKKALDLDPHYEKARKNLEKLRADMAKRSS